MAEGREDIPLGPFGSEGRDEGDEREASFGGHHDEVLYPARRLPDGSVVPGRVERVRDNPGFEPYEETSQLIDNVGKRLEDKQKAEDFLRSIFVDPQVEQILYGVDEYDRVWVSLKNNRALKYTHQPSGRFLSKGGKEMPKSLKGSLGQSYDEGLSLNDQIIEQNEDTLQQLSQSRRATK